jgi:phospholipid/cholesterol/gamma-HCH transport system substrate-binding protein
MRSLHGVGAPLIKFLIFAVVTLLSTALLAGTIANQIGGDTVTYQARFTDATGLVNGDEIRIAGVRVGEVDDISLVDRKVALVKFSVQRSVELPRSTEATIKFRNLIGQRYIALDQGVGPPGQLLPAGATLPLQQTHPAVNLTQLFNGFRPLFQALSPQDVNQLSFELIQVLQGEGGTVSSLLAHTASLTSTIADKDQVIGQVIDNLNQVLDTVNARDDQFTQLVITVRQLVSGLSKDRDTIGESIQSIGELTESTADLLHDARPPLRKDIKSLGDLAGNLNDNQDLVDHFLRFLPHKLDALVPLGSYASWFNFYLCDIGGSAALPGGQSVTINAISNPADRCKADYGGGDSGSDHDSAPKLPALPSLPGLPEANPAAAIPGLGGGHK